MHVRLHTIATIASYIPLITNVNGLGFAIVHNRCQFPIYLWPIDSERNPLDGITVAANGQYSEQYHIPSSGGVSIKISTTNNKQSPITQFEYTVKSYSGNQLLWYDGSNVDCVGAECPFWNYGINLKASDQSCPTRDCAVARLCDGFYIVSSDDRNTLSCSQEADTIFTVCSANSGSGVSSKQTPADAPTFSSVAVTRQALTSAISTRYSGSSQAGDRSNHYWI